MPTLLETDVFRIRPLKAADAALDYEAVMCSVGHLKGVLGDDWPDEETTFEDNLRALEWHEKQFERREQFTYTVMNVSETKCLGCIYIRPSRLDDFDAEVAVWVTQDAFVDGLDDVLCNTGKDWLGTDWPFDRAVFPGREVAWTELYDRLSEQDRDLH